ncbi:MAG: NADPH:quinone reductase [Nitrospinaceae bacterium]|nr:NADPH:quinone reductase [Nitrospinaceae bacterium]
MKAMRVHAYSDTLKEPMVLDDIPVPSPGPGEVLVKVKAIGVNPVDLSIRRGLPNYVSHLKLPHVLGSEISGEVEACGEGVSNFSKGEKVFGYCSTRDAYSEYALLRENCASLMPEGVSFTEAAALSVGFQTAWHALVIQAKVTAGETVLVHGGAGGVGIATIQLAKALGCRVLTTVSSKEKAEFCLSYGADETINYREEDFPSRVMALTGDVGVNVIVDVAACENFSKNLEAAAVKGRVVIVGMGTGKGPMTTGNVSGMMGKNLAVYGISARNLTPVISEVIAGLNKMWKTHNLRVPVDREMPFEQANECHDVLLSGKFFGKLVLTF